MLKAKVKTYPNKVFEQEIRKRGLQIKLLWQIKGPKDTAIEWITMYYIAPVTVVHFTYERDGWDVHFGSEMLSTEDTVNQIVERVKYLNHQSPL